MEDCMRATLKTTLIALAVICALCTAAFAANETGGRVGEFLSFGAGARPLGMGKAFVAVADDASATYWNPAGLTQIDKPQLTTFYSSLFEDTSYSFISYAHPFNGPDIMGINVVMLNSDNFEKVNSLNQTEGTFSDQDMSIDLCYARRFYQNISVGLGAKYITRSLAEDKDTYISSDLGLLYAATPSLSIGLSLQNIASAKMKGDSEDKFAPELRAGIAYRMLNDDLLLSMDLSRALLAAQKIHVGVEYKLFKDLLVLRIGSDNVELSGGVGLTIDNFSFDYAFAKQELGDSHRFSFTYSFGDMTAASREKKAEGLLAKAKESYMAGRYTDAYDDVKEALKVYPEGKDEKLLKTKLDRVFETLKKQKGDTKWGDGKTGEQMDAAVKDYLNQDLYVAKDRIEYVLSQEPDNALAQDLLAKVEATIAETNTEEDNPIAKRMDKITNLFYAGEYDKVIIEAKKVVAIDPTIADAYKKLGSAYYMKRKMNEAIAAWEKAIELDPKDTRLKNFVDGLKKPAKTSKVSR